MASKNIRYLVFSAMMIAIATVLSLVPLGIQMPLGGKLTLCSMLPICLVSLKFGIGRGLLTSLAYAAIQILVDLPAATGGLLAWGLSAWEWVGCLALDYVFAYGIIGIAGLWRGKGRMGAVVGVAVALFGRFVFHFLSGCIVFPHVEKFLGIVSPPLYSLCYNGAYMLPEIILTGIVTWLLYRVFETQLKAE